MKIYETKVEAGTKQWLKIPVDEECSLKAAAFCGSRPGKRLIVTAGVHGCEYIGILAVSRLIQELDPRQMKGEVVFLPIANEGGFYKEIKQLVPEDGVNLNRAFPGTEMGSRSAKIAAAVETYLYPDADFLVDLHSGDIHEMVVPFAFFPVAAGETVEKKAAAAARALSLSWRVASTAKNGLYSWAAQKGIPALLLERGGPPLLREHRLYQADWLMRYYGFRASELLSEKHPNFNVFLDPKCDWALQNLGEFPVEINRAPYETLLRVPGIGVKSAMRIVAARKQVALRFEDLKKMGVVLKRAVYFITCSGRMMYPVQIHEDAIAAQLISEEKRKQWQLSQSGLYRQMSLFDDFHMAQA